MSTCAWVEEMEQLAYNPVLMFKPQEVDDTSGLAKDDFMLVRVSKRCYDDVWCYLGRCYSWNYTI